MNIIHGVLVPLKKVQRLTAVVTLGALALFSQLSQAAPYSQVVDLGVLDGGAYIALEGTTPKQDEYLFTLVSDGSILVNVLTIDFDQQVHKLTLWDESDTGKQLGKGVDIQSLDLTAGTVYKLVVSGGNRAYSGDITVAAIPLPASALLFGSALMGMVFGKKRLKQK
ncbi:MAG: hypothetical protein V7746_12675 [Halioglobus sp.]